MNRQLVCKTTRCLEFKDGTIPKLTSNGVIIKVLYAGICHSDAHAYDDERHQSFLPTILGHEVAGTIHAIGDMVKEKLVIGQGVVIHAWGGCRECAHCKAENPNCSNKHGPQAHNYGIWKDGGFQEYMMVESSYSIVPVPDSIPLDIACLVPCSGITAYNAVENCRDSIKEAIRVKGKANVLLMGVGGVGYWATEIAKTVYGDSITLCAADLFEDKLKDAKQAGADLTVQISKQDDKKTIIEKLNKAFDERDSNAGYGKVDAAIDFVNSAMTLQCIYDVMSTDSTIALVGVQGSSFPPVDVLRLIVDCIRIQGIYAGPKRNITDVFNLLQKKKIKGPIIQHKTMDDIKPTIEKMAGGELLRGRVVVKMAT